MGRSIQPPAPPDQPVQALESQAAPPAKPHHVEETKPIPVIEPPLAVHNLDPAPPTVISKPIVPVGPVIIEIDPTTVPQIMTTEVQVKPELVPSLPAYDLGVVEMTTHIAVSPQFEFLTPTLTKDNKPADVKATEVEVVEIEELVKVPPVTVTTPVPYVPPKESPKPVLPEPKKTVTDENECLGRKLAPGDVVDGDILPPSEKKWNPAVDNKTVRWFDMQWKSDGNYELVNWCVFMTHMELELRRL